MDRKGEGVSRFSVENLLPHNTGNFIREIFGVSENLGYREFLCIRGLYHDFLSKGFCLKVPRAFVGEHICVFRNFFLTKNLLV